MTDLSPTPPAKPSDLLSRPLLVASTIDWEKVLYIAFIAIAILTRFWGLGARVMSHDESLHTQFSYQFYDGQGFTHTPLMHGPFLFHITAVSYWLFGASDLTARIPVAILSVIIVAVPYFLRDWLGKAGALVTSFIFLISPYLMYYGRYIRHDTPVILWALIIFIAIMFYLREQKDSYLWWFAVGLALMFATKEVSFIYTAIFGSFVLLRLLVRIGAAPWLKEFLPELRIPIGVVLLGVLLLGIGFLGHQVVASQETQAELEATAESEPFAADPNAAAATTDETVSPTDAALRWLMVGGIIVAGAGLFLVLREIRPNIEQFAELDIVILFTTMVLPMATPLLMAIVGWSAQDYTIDKCVLSGQETMSSLQVALAQISSPICRAEFASSGMIRILLFLAVALVVSALLGFWWNAQRWVVFAAIYYAIFFTLYTSVFTNGNGFLSGLVGSLGYWLEQHDVQRGNQPTFYYLIVVPFYEFLALIFSLLAIRLWGKKNRINGYFGYWLLTLLVAYLGYSFSNWFFNRLNPLTEAEPNRLIGTLVAAFVLGVAFVYFVTVRRKQLSAANEKLAFTDLLRFETFFSFVPFLIWWFLLTWVAYSEAGEKMPWLSTHFVIPMGLLAGWYLNEKLEAAGGVRAVFSRTGWVLMGLTAVLITTAAMGLSPLLLGQISFGDQSLTNLNAIGRFLGGLVVAGVVYYLWRQQRERATAVLSRTTAVWGLFIVLALLTMRFTYMANFVNADSASEYMVYAHGAPAAKSAVLDQVESLSLRLNGDKTMQVAFGGSGVAWPFTWYMRDYPNRNYFAENPTASLVDYPVVLVGRSQMDNVDRLLARTHDYQTYTYLWWPMEAYRNISWNAILGNPAVPPEQRHSLADPAVRQALWDIFFYRDYTLFGQTYGGNYTAGNWPLRDDLRLYIRRDVLANLWDYGVGAVNAEGLVDPYAEGEISVAPSLVLNSSGVAGAGEGDLSAPRNMAVDANGRIYVADAGNHRIDVFAPDGTFVTSWGSFGVETGQFNEPWGIAVDEAHVYVADTWNHRIQKFTLEGDWVATFGRSGAPADDPTTNGLGLFFGPREIMLYGQDSLIVTDTGNHRIQVLTRDGEFTAQTGSQGSAPGQMNEPVGLAYGLNGDIYLADTWNGRVQQFTNELFPIFEWQVDAWRGNSINNKPYMATDSNGRLYITDPEVPQVLIFDPVGNYLGRFGQFGTDTTHFGLINGIFIDRNDAVYIADAGNNRVLKFDPIFGAPPVVEPDQVEDVPVEADDGGDTAVEPTAVAPTPTESDE